MKISLKNAICLAALALSFALFAAKPIWESEGKELYYRGLSAEGTTSIMRNLIEDLKTNPERHKELIQQLEETLVNMEYALGMRDEPYKDNM